jgi:chaperone required for assembly of F1-ATPase
VHLDGRPVRLPGGGTLAIATRGLAEAMAREWESRPTGELIRAEDIPLTRLAATAQVRMVPEKGPTVAAVAAYGKTDLLCYRAAAPEALVQLQEAAWQPWLEWAARELEARLLVARGVMPLKQDEAALEALHRAVAAAGPAALASLGLAVPALGSLVLGLALVRGRLGPAEAAACAFLDERFQAEMWGEDREAAERREAVGAEIALAQRFVALAEEGA